MFPFHEHSHEPHRTLPDSALRLGSLINVLNTSQVLCEPIHIKSGIANGLPIEIRAFSQSEAQYRGFTSTFRRLCSLMCGEPLTLCSRMMGYARRGHSLQLMVGTASGKAQPFPTSGGEAASYSEYAAAFMKRSTL
jgi:hypothetical protein